MIYILKFMLNIISNVVSDLDIFFFVEVIFVSCLTQYSYKLYDFVKDYIN